MSDIQPKVPQQTSNQARAPRMGRGRLARALSAVAAAVANKNLKAA